MPDLDKVDFETLQTSLDDEEDFDDDDDWWDWDDLEDEIDG